MANFEVPQNPVYKSELRKIEITDGVHADIVNSMFKTLLENQEYLKKQLNQETLKQHPVGSLYFSESNVNPGTFLGGIWVEYAKGRTLVGVDAGNGNFNTAGKTGGSATTTLSAANMPPHIHSFSWKGRPSGSASTSVGINEAGNHVHTAGSLRATNTTISGRIANIIVQGSNGLDAYGAFSASLGGDMGYYGGNTNGGDKCLDAFDMNAPHSHSIEGNTEWAGNHSHSASASTTLNLDEITVSNNTGSTGNGSDFNNLQPYISVYIFKRTA